MKVGGLFMTNGLISFINKEIKLLVGGRTDDEYFKLLKYLIDYIVISKAVIKDDHTIGYHSWILKFVSSDEDSYMLYEGDQNGLGFIPGVDIAIRVINDQENECNQRNAACLFPTFDQLIVISKGVYEGLPVQGVRYPSPPHMCGWWLSTDLYDGKVESMMTEHYYHIAFKRPGILKYLALPFGYRFMTGLNFEDDVWFDEACTR